MQLSRISYYALNLFWPILIAMLVALFTPRAAMKPVIITAVCLIIAWFGVLRPIKMLYALAVLYAPQPASVSQVISGNVPNVSMSFGNFIAFLKNSPSLRSTFLSTWTMSFINSIIKAAMAAVCMLSVYGVKSFFGKKKEDRAED
ncbi:MAG: hypothetical protein IJR59_07485 [Firmicutes bacterium]|nr:hypothetical protein [Bacillota bacterium]